MVTFRLGENRKKRELRFDKEGETKSNAGTIRTNNTNQKTKENNKMGLDPSVYHCGNLCRNCFLSSGGF